MMDNDKRSLENISPDILLFIKLFSESNLEEKYTYSIRWEPEDARKYSGTKIHYGDIHVYNVSPPRLGEYYIFKLHGLFDKYDGPMQVHSYDKMRVKMEPDSLLFESEDVNKIIDFIK